jgi:hypothetical protein
MQGNSPAPEVWRSQQPLLECFLQWACSSVGRAPRSQRGGQGFEPPHVHHSKQTKRSTCGEALRGLESQNIGCIGFCIGLVLCVGLRVGYAVKFRHGCALHVQRRVRVSLRYPSVQNHRNKSAEKKAKTETKPSGLAKG